MNKTTLRKSHTNFITQTDELLDIHRIKPKRKGGEIQKDNVIVMTAVDNMKLNEAYREREEELENLKMLIDAREHLRKQLNSTNNRISAATRNTDKLDNNTLDFLIEIAGITSKKLSKQDRIIEKHLKSMTLPIVGAALKIVGIGPITVAYLITYIDINQARYASSLWAYVGLDKPSHERYTKNESSGGNKTLRTVLYTTATSIEKNRKSPYRAVYESEKLKLSNSLKITKSRNTQGKLIECAWKDTKPCHRRGAALRKLIKHLLADFWYVWRTMEGLDTPELYVVDKLGHEGIIKPEARGWCYSSQS